MKNIDKKIGVFFGGKNTEHDISIITGQFIISTLKKNNIEVIPVYISKEGKFYSNEKLSELKFFKNDFEKELKKMKEISFSKIEDKLVLKEKSFFGKKYFIDLAFPALHGQFGEDGSIQGFFEFLNIPYAGAGIYTSSVSIDKALTKNFFKNNNIPITDFLIYKKKDFSEKKEEFLNEINSKLTYPIFVKPTRQGSSIGISKVDKFEDLEEALDLAFFYDNEVLVENGVPNVKDLTCAVLSNGKEIISSEVQDSIFEDGFLDYEKKYLNDGGTQTGESKNIIIPAEINKEIEEKIKKYSKEIFKKLNGNGTMRIDFLLNEKSGELFANEINTLPGTLYHHLWEKSGKEIDEVIDWMIDDGIKRYEENNKNSIDFKSNVLNEANSMKLQN